MTDGDADPVIDNQTAHRFELLVDGHLAELVYRRRDDRLELIHTGVPAELEGQGVGGRLVRAAIDVAVRDGLSILPTCLFARAWLTRHPAEAARVTIVAVN